MLKLLAKLLGLHGDSETRRAWTEGRAANLAGRTVASNPYRMDSNRHRAWFRGWCGLPWRPEKP